MAAPCPANFILRVLHFERRGLGDDCNGSHSPQCDTVSCARGTTLSCLTREAVEIRRLFFRLQPGSRI